MRVQCIYFHPSTLSPGLPHIAGPGLFPISAVLGDPQPVNVDQDEISLLELLILASPPGNPSNVPPDTPPTTDGDSPLPDGPGDDDANADAQGSPGSAGGHRHHRHRSRSGLPDSSALSPMEDDPVTGQMQAAEDIWNSASDFRSATSLYKDVIQDVWADLKRVMETYLQQSRFSPVSGDAFRKGGLDGVRVAAEWSERNAEILRKLSEAMDDVVTDQLELTEKLKHLAFETLEVCRACNIPLHTPGQMRPIDIALLRAKALTSRPRPRV